jgi:hypothetical protein
MQNPYQAPQSVAHTRILGRAWHAKPSVRTDLKTVWGWLTRSWGMLFGISMGFSLISTVLGGLCVAWLPKFVGAMLTMVISASVGLVIAAAAIRVVLDHEDGRELAVGRAVQFGLSHFGVLIVPVALRYLLGVIAAMFALFPIALVHGRLISIEAMSILGVQDPTKTVFGGAWELGAGDTLSCAGSWFALYFPIMLVSGLMGLASLAFMESELPFWTATALTLPNGLLVGSLSMLPPLGGLARLLSVRHAAGQETEYRWRLMED